MLRLPVAVALRVPHDWFTVSEAPNFRSVLLQRRQTNVLDIAFGVERGERIVGIQQRRDLLVDDLEIERLGLIKK